MLETAIDQERQKRFEQEKTEGKTEEGQAEMLIILLETRLG